jgi:hypothetical protein
LLSFIYEKYMNHSVTSSCSETMTLQQMMIYPCKGIRVFGQPNPS